MNWKLKAKLGFVRVNLLEVGRANLQPRLMTKHSPFCCFKTSPEIIRLAVMFIQAEAIKSCLNGKRQKGGP